MHPPRLYDSDNSRLIWHHGSEWTTQERSSEEHTGIKSVLRKERTNNLDAEREISSSELWSIP